MPFNTYGGKKVRLGMNKTAQKALI